MARTRRVRPQRRRASPFVTLAAATVVVVTVTGAVGLGVGVEVHRRLDSSWHYRTLPLTDCSVDQFQNYHHNGVDYLCYAVSTPALPVDGRMLVSTVSRHGPPLSEQRWLHVADGRVDRVGGAHIPLWLLLFLLIPLAVVAGQIHAVRRAHRAGLLWHGRRARTRIPTAGGGGSTPF